MATNTVIVCPECKRKFKGKEELQGKKVRCPLCSHCFVVQSLAVDRTTPASPAAGSRPKPEAKPEPGLKPDLKPDKKPDRKIEPDLKPLAFQDEPDLDLSGLAPEPGLKPLEDDPPSKPFQPSPDPGLIPLEGEEPPPSAAAPRKSPGKPAGKSTAKTSSPKAKKKGGPTWAEDDDDPNPYGVTALDLSPRCPHCANLMENEEAIICLYCGYNTQTREMGATKKTIALTGGEHFVWLLPGLLCVLGIVFLVNLDIFFCILFPGLVQDSWMDFLDHESVRLWTVITTQMIAWALGYFAFKRLVLEPMPPEKVKD
jgi:hypothetical protein